MFCCILKERIIRVFDSHYHGHNGLSATVGAFSLITFSSLDDLKYSYIMYAFYDRMKLDTKEDVR